MRFIAIVAAILCFSGSQLSFAAPKVLLEQEEYRELLAIFDRLSAKVLELEALSTTQLEELESLVAKQRESRQALEKWVLASIEHWKSLSRLQTDYAKLESTLEEALKSSVRQEKELEMLKTVAAVLGIALTADLLLRLLGK